MATRRYLNFDLLLERDGEGQYEARVTAAPVTGLPHVRFQLPFDEKSLKILLMELDPGRTDVRGAGGTGQQAAKEFGGPLFDAIFTGKLAFAWNSSLEKVAAQEGSGLRLRIRVAEEAVDLAGLPWELLYDAKGRAFPAQSEITPLVRFLDVDSDADAIQVTGPLRVLAIISSPVELPQLDVEREWAHIQTALAAKVREGLVVVDRLAEPTVDALGDWLLVHDTHVIHFVGHGDFDASGGEGFVFFQNERGGGDPVSASVLGPFVHDHDPLRMVVINACRTARVGPSDPYGGMAQGLVQQGATAVVAMQFPISDPAAVMFTGKFYGALAAGLPVDQAVSYARKALYAKFRSEWATPVLFMRSPDGNIFQDLQPPPGWVWHEPQASEPVELDRHDPSISELRPTDIEVTDLTDPVVAAPPGGTDPYGFLFEREPGPEPPRPEPEPPRPKPEPPRPEPGPEPGPGPHLKVLAAAVVVVLVVVAAVVAWSFRGGGLPESQMLVAGGDRFLDLDIYLIDADDPGTKVRLIDDGVNWLPVLSPDRRSMVYLRRQGPVSQLRIASATDGSDDRALELPPECDTDVSRPAWVPDTEDLVLRCTQGDTYRLVRVGLDGDLVDVLLTVGSGPAADFGLLGDPTVSGDGRTVVFWGSDDDESDAGALYELDLGASGATPGLLLEETTYTFEYSDAVFSRADEGQEWLAWRAAVGTVDPRRTEVYAAPFDGEGLGEPVQISDPVSDAREQDPMFSPDGKSIVYGVQPIDRTTGELVISQELWVASVEAPGDRRRISADDPDFWAVPAWSGR